MKSTNNTFNIVLGTVAGFTFISGGTSLWLSFQPELSPQQIRVFEIATGTWQTGIGAVFGLLGSQAIRNRTENEESENER